MNAAAPACAGHVGALYFRSLTLRKMRKTNIVFSFRLLQNDIYGECGAMLIYVYVLHKSTSLVEEDIKTYHTHCTFARLCACVCMLCTQKYKYSFYSY